MQIERQCAACGTAIESLETDELRCPACGAVLETSAALNPYASPQAESRSDNEPEKDPGSPRSRAQGKLRIPLMGCRVILLVSLLVSSFDLVSVLIILAFLDGQNLDAELFVIGTMYPLAVLLFLVGLYGLHHAAKLENPIWAGIGVIISGLVGIAFWVVLPFVIWAVVVLCSRDAREGFRSARRAPE
ncbi:MAG: hypothetical protein WDZ51_09360 [Pirellulaceae bacterium]